MFYWEFVNILRKVVILSINIIVPESRPILKAFCGTIILVGQLRLQKALRPYKQELINDLEQKEILTSAITLYGAILFVQEEAFEAFNLVAFVFIVLANLWFFSMWFYAFCTDKLKWQAFQLLHQLLSYLYKYDANGNRVRSKITTLKEEVSSCDELPKAPSNSDLT